MWGSQFRLVPIVQQGLEYENNYKNMLSSSSRNLRPTQKWYLPQRVKNYLKIKLKKHKVKKCLYK